jgi:hypothetical protein
MKLKLLIFTLLFSIFSFAQPANDNCANATALTVDGPLLCSQTTNAATTQSGEYCADSGGGVTPRTVWYSFVATNTTMVLNVIRTNTTNCFARVSVYGPNVACLPSGATAIYDCVLLNGDPGFYQSLTGLTIGGTYRIQYNGQDCGGGNDRAHQFCIGIYNPAPNNSVPNSSVIDECGVTFNGTTQGGYFPSGNGTGFRNLDNNLTTVCPACPTGYGADVPFVINNDSWFSFCASTTGTWQVTFTVGSCTLSGANSGLQMAIFTGTPTNLTWLSQAPSPTSSGNTWTSPNITLTAGECVYLMVDGFAGDACGYSYTLTPISGSSCVLFSCSSSTIWNGSSWSNGAPNSNVNAVINGTYDTGVNGSFTTCNLTVNTTQLLTIRSNDNVTVVNDVYVDGSLVVNNNGSLVQIQDSGVNTGNIIYERTAMARELDYIYWSSPVASFDVSNLPNSLRYIWNTTIANTNGGQGNWVAASGNMIGGKGYIARASNGSSTPIATTTSFNGVPYNGVITLPIQRGSYEGADYAGNNGITITRFSDNWNLIGNPYPSSISVLDFLNMNTNIEGAVRIWTHGTLPSTAIPNPFYGSYVANYTPNDYITHNGTGTVSGPAGFNGYIAGGQGFMVNMNDGPATTESITFNNSLRSNTYDNSQFYRVATDVSNNNRIWLDIIDNNNVSGRTLIGYVNNATDDKDRLYDAVTSVSTSMHIYSLIGQDKMTIQGKSLPFNSEDRVKIGYNVLNYGLYSIGISAVDGIFDTQEIYLKDYNLNVIHDLKKSKYEFISGNGEFNERFEIIYKNKVVEFNEFTTYVLDGSLVILNPDKEEVNEIEVYDMLGKLILTKSKLGKHVEFNLPLNVSNGVYLVNIKTKSGLKLSKKVIKYE